ncbi:MAG: hypothetical protein HYX60_04105, partial [Legionella longbeachae]|nr:hypothetical protein [Legionella longbeachae]
MYDNAHSVLKACKSNCQQIQDSFFTKNAVTENIVKMNPLTLHALSNYLNKSKETTEQKSFLQPFFAALKKIFKIKNVDEEIEKLQKITSQAIKDGQISFKKDLKDFQTKNENPKVEDEKTDLKNSF